MCCLDYDNTLSIHSSKDTDFKISVPRRIEPDTMGIYDIYHSPDKTIDGFGKKMIIFGTRDES